MEKTNIAELLRDCPKGMELDCTTWENVTFEKVVNDLIYVKRNNKDAPFFDKIIVLNKYGCCTDHRDEKCRIFPKDKNTWEGFCRPFKDGDILTNERGSIFIYKGPMYYSKLLSDFYCGYRISDGTFVPKLFKDKHFGDISECRFATEEEKQKLFDVIEKNGYKWNAETKTLEKLPKFKVGDRVKRKNVNYTHIVTIAEIDGEYYGCVNEYGQYSNIFIASQDNYELVPNKFDINTLVPFESKVLVRSGDLLGEWKPAIFGIYRSKYNNFYVVGGTCWEQCIPYEGNEHLLGTTNDCDEYYKT